MTCKWRTAMVALTVVALCGGSVVAAPPTLADDVMPLLKIRCVRCHGPAKQEGGLNLSLPQSIARGGDNGEAVLAGDLDESLLWSRIAADEMPPDEPLPDDEESVLRAWIAAGAQGLPTDVPDEPEGDEHWAFQPLADVEPPAVKNEAVIRTPIDRFVQVRLEQDGLSIGPEADRETLIRRVAFDLTGLPPSPAEIDGFVNDPSDDAYERMVERFLESPAYGERWGKYWLDAAGYADSNGYFGADTDRPLAWRYRDYVIRAVNDDKPFDQFIREQLAGDQISGYRPDGAMPPETVEMLTATHFLRNSPDGTDSSDGNADEVRADKYAVLDGELQIIGSALLGMTIQCARCHDHKFEPFPQADYYRLQAVIYPAFNIESWVKPRDRQTPAVSAADLAAWEAHSKSVDERIAAARDEFKEWLRQHRERGRELFAARFDSADPLAESWSNAVPGDVAPAGQPGVNIDSSTAPGAYAADGRLQIVESRDDGDRAFSTRATFDWTPNEQGEWIQATFDLVDGGESAPYVGYFVALRDFNDAASQEGGNVLIDGNAAGKASIHVDYPGGDSDGRGQIGQSGYVPGANYGVRVTNVGDGKYELSQVVDGVIEEGAIILSADDLPDGGFGFEYCCGRSFVVDNVVVEASDRSFEDQPDERALSEQRSQRRAELEAAVAALEEQRGERPPMLAAVTDLSAEQPEVRLLNRGDPKTPGDVVEPAAPGALSEPGNPANLPLTGSESELGAGRRLAFARWLTQPNSRAAARLARVTANRWWQHRFGVGIVATPDNLGYSGGAPTHPELLEYLAARLASRGWSAKDFHRLTLHSAVYRQTSAPRDDGLHLDPNNRLLWRYPLRRLDAEAIRDAMLYVSGNLDARRGGPYVPTTRAADGDVIVDAAADGAQRRSVYLQQRRTQVLGMLEVFDAPSITFNCTQRLPTTIPLQSLKLMNSQFVRDRSSALARRAAEGAGGDDSARIQRVFLLALGRTPSEGERDDARRFLETQITEYAAAPAAEELAWTDLCQAILSSNGFLYVR